MRRVNGYKKISDFIRNKVSNLKMDIDDTENPFGDGVGNRGVDDDDENIPLISTSSRRGSEDTTYHRTHGETSFIEGIENIRPLSQKKVNGTKLGIESKENFRI